MPGRTAYTSDEIEACRDNCDALLAVWAANDVEDTTLESLVFVQAVVVLDAWFAHRDARPRGRRRQPDERGARDRRLGRGQRGTPAGPGARSAGSPSAPCSGSPSGDEIELTANGFERLAAAYLAAIEKTYLEFGG